MFFAIMLQKNDKYALQKIVRIAFYIKKIILL